MLDKVQKNRILENIKDKETKMLVSNILDKAIRFEKSDDIFFSNFLNLHELRLLEKILDYLKVNYTDFYINENIEKRNIGFIPSYLISKKKEILNEHISCIKVIPKNGKKLLHKDYMGAIYSLGLKREFIGDIIAKENVAYFFCMKNVEDYFNLNLISVGNQEVRTEILDIYSDEVMNLSPEYIKKEYIVASLRVDAILSEIYNLSRSEVKDKILKGDLYINDENIFYPSTILVSDDIISFRKCGKFKYKEELRKTKNSNLVISIYKYS